MPLSARNSARRRRKNPDEKLPERPAESTSSAQVMAPTRMKLRVRRRDNAATGTAGGSGPVEEEEERSRASGSHSSRRKNSSKTSTATPTAAPSSPPTSSASASARAVMAAEEASPDSKCPICLDRFNNLAYLDRCLHRFCFPCIQEWSHNKAECPLCKQPFASILHSVRAEDDFKEYTLRPAPANSSVAATVAMVAAMASAARSDHQMRLMLRRHRVAGSGETTTRRRRRERGGRGGEGRRVEERTGIWEWYLDSPPPPLTPLPHHPAISPVVAEDSEEGEDLEEQSVRGGANLVERGVIFEGLTGLGGAVAPVAPNDRASRRLMTRLAARQRLQREGGTVRRLRERETVAFRRALYRCGIQVRGVAGVSGNQGQQQQRDISAESFRRSPSHLNRLRPWLRRELTVLYGAHGSLVDIVQRIIMARLARHGLEDTPTIEEELRPFLLARTEHFLHELVSFARSPLSLDNYDLQASYEPPTTALELDEVSSSSESSSVIAISEGEEEERGAGARSEEGLLGRAHTDVIQTGSCLSLSGWDDETPGPSYSTAEPSCLLAPLSFSPTPQEAANEEGGEKGAEGEEECLIVGYKKPIAERTPELVQLSSDTEEEELEKEDKPAETVPSLPSAAPPPSHLPTIPPSTSGACREEQDNGQKEKDGEAGWWRSRARSWSGSSGRSRNSVCTLSPVAPRESEQRQEKAGWRDRRQSGGEAAREKRRRKRRRRGRERKSGTLYNPNRSIYPAMMRRRSHSPSPFLSSTESGSPLPPSPPDSSWEYHRSQVSPLTSSVSSPSRSSSSSPLCSSLQPSSPPPQTPPTPSLSPSDRSNSHHGEKPGGKRKYKSRHLDSDIKDPTWRPSGGPRREKKRERRRRGRDGGGRKRHRTDSCGGESSRRSRGDRSPSVEIIYEGTITSDATQPPARKRRRRRHRRTQHSSSPVIITLDSDSNLNDNKNNSSSSTPLSSQQTVDFSDLPPLPLVHSAGVGGALDAEIGELPVDILDRGSDGSETEPVGKLKVTGPIAINNSDNSDGDVESVSLLGCDDDTHRPIRAADSKAAHVHTRRETGSVEDVVHRRHPDVSTCDSQLLGTILNDLRAIAAPKCDLPLNFEASCSPDSRRRRYREPCEVRKHDGGWSAAATCDGAGLLEERLSNEVRDQNRGFDLPASCTSIPPPPLDQAKEGRDVPPLLKQASPVRSYNRNTPPPLKHKDAGSPRRSPPRSCGADPGGRGSPALLTSNAIVSPIDSRLGTKLPPDGQAIPPISTLKRHFTGGLALRGELASPSSLSAAPPEVRAFAAAAIHSTSHKPPADSRSAPETTRLDFSCLHSVKLHSSRGGTVALSPGPPSPPANLHPVSSSASINLHSARSGWTNQKPAFTDSTSGSCRIQTASPHSCQVAPIHLHPSSSAAERAAAGRGVFSGVNSDAPLPVFVSSDESRTQTLFPPVDSLSSSTREKQSASVVSSVLTAAPSDRSSPADLHSSSAASDALTNSRAAPPDDVHCPRIVPPANFNSPCFVMNDRHLNHTALSSEHAIHFHTSRRKCSSQSDFTSDSHSKRFSDSKPQNCFDPTDPPSKQNPALDSERDPRPPVDPPSKRTQRDFHTNNHITSSSRSIDASDSQAPVDERSESNVWNANAHGAT